MPFFRRETNLSSLRAPARLGRRLICGLAVASPLCAGPAAAHAVVVVSDPAAGSTLASPPRQLTIRFNSRIDHGRSRLVLVGPEAVQLALDPAPEGEPTVLEARIGPDQVLAPGAWRLRWQVLAVDGHITRGDIFFSVIGR